VTLVDAEASLGLIDESPNPIQIQEGRAELEMLKQAMRDLTPRRRAILLASRVQGIPMHTVAARHGISRRMAQRELKTALTYCAERLEKKIVQRFGPQSRHVSDNETET
jgi:RNA polymerase sigma-70 factor (ECF subfamily)